MKKLFLYIVTAIIFGACTTDDVQTPPVKAYSPNDYTGIVATIPTMDLRGGNNMSRSTLHYDEALNEMKFMWTENEKIGIFPILDDISRSQQQCYILIDGTVVDKTHSCLGTFKNEDTDVQTVDISETYLYTAFCPWREIVPLSGTNYTNIPISYLGQQQNCNVKMGYYYDNPYQDMTQYNQSEVDAAAHLGKYDYLVASNAASQSGNLYLNFQHVGATVRFYLWIEPDLIYDDLQVVNEKQFITEGTVNTTTNVITPITTNTTIKLDFNNEKFNFTDKLINSEETNTDKPYYNDRYYGVDAYFIIAYMEVAPINLTTESTLYLRAHDRNDVKKYFRATLCPLNIQAGHYYQWTYIPDSDEPIRFDPITVEEWEEGITFTNPDGAGTEGW